MNNKKYMFLFLFILCFSLFSLYLNSLDTYDKAPDTNYRLKVTNSKEKSEKISGEDIKVDKYYFLTLEESLLCAYEVQNNIKTLINSCEINLSHIDESEKEKLLNGIKTTTYEKVCMYFENYVS